MFRELSRKHQNLNRELTLLGQYGIGDPASSIKHRTPNIRHPAPDIKHPTPNIFFKLLKQTQITSTKNPFYALYYGMKEQV
jgi:hypothetical protein